jgi:hypothetical protein
MWMDAPTVAAQGYAAVTNGQPVYINGHINRTIAGSRGSCRRESSAPP